MSEPPVHPRAAAIRRGYVFLAAWFLLLSIGLGFLSKDSATAVVGASVFSVCFAAGTAMNERFGFVTSRQSRVRRRRVVLGASAISAICFVVTLTWLGAEGTLAVGPAATSCAISVSCIGAVLWELLR